MEAEASFIAHKSPLVYLIQIQIMPTAQYHIFETHFSIILSFTPMSLDLL
jgi:hypothetical protein